MLGDIFRKKRYAVPVGASSPNKRKLSPQKYEEWKAGSIAFDTKNTEFISDKAAFMKTYIDACVRVIPAVSGAVWVWKNLCSTKQQVKFNGGSEAQRNKASESIKLLDRTLLTMNTVRSGGMDLLTDLWFKYIFSHGRFAGIMVPNKDLDGIEEFRIINPYTVRFDEQLNAYVEGKDGLFMKMNPATFYFFAMNMDTENPYGNSMMESASSLIDIANNMIQDMSYSSSNAGVPRLHFKIKQPEIMSGESQDAYATRANQYFDSTIQELSDIGPDDNLYTWSDVECSIAGGALAPSGFVCRSVRQIIDEDVCTAFHLFPWVLAKSYGTTKNWVSVQFDLLMSQADSLQREAKRFAEWLRNTHLLLQGIPVTCSQNFTQPRDPGAKISAQANSLNFDTVIGKIQSGMISPDDGARELGYEKAFAPKLAYTAKTNNPQSSTNDMHEAMEEVLEGINQMQGAKDE